MSFPQRPPPVQACVLTDGHAGNRRQAEALAQALGLAWEAPPLSPALPWRALAPRRLPGAARALGRAFAAALAAPAPLAIGCGRQGALATRLLRERGARAVQILDPRLDPGHWDLVVVPGHDRLRGGNVVRLLGSLHPVDDAWLAQGAARFPALLALPRPRVVVLAGGPTRHAPWSAARLRALLDALGRELRTGGGSLLATVSRRTPEAARRALREAVHGLPGLLWEGEGETPYPGMLACADRIVCTPDSVNMLSEACATAAPVYVADPARATGRIGRFLAALGERGRIRAADAALAPFTATPLRETARVAAEVRARLGLHG